MKSIKGFYLTLICFVPMLIIAQDEDGAALKNEFKVNGLYLILGGLEVDYEVILNEESSFGVSATYIFEANSQWKWGITPHYRLFFGKEPASGFFLEGNGAIFGFEDYYYDILPRGGVNSGEKNKVGAGLGLAVGGKFLTRRKVVVEINGGLGRIFNNNTFDTVYPRFGINIGKRF